MFRWPGFTLTAPRGSTRSVWPPNTAPNLTAPNASPLEESNNASTAAGARTVTGQLWKSGEQVHFVGLICWFSPLLTAKVILSNGCGGDRISDKRM